MGFVEFEMEMVLFFFRSYIQSIFETIIMSLYISFANGKVYDK